MPDVPIIIRGDDKVLAEFRRLQGTIFGRQLLSEIGAFATTIIETRTAEGKDFTGKAFKPYSPQYKLFRASEGRPTSKVDLNFFGTMVAALTYEVKETTNKVRIYFLNTPDERNNKIRSPQKAYFLNEDRKFFALSSSDISQIQNIVEKYIRKVTE